MFQVALLSPPYSVLTYKQPDYFPGYLWQVGQRVFVPLGKTSLRLAILLGTEEKDNSGQYEIKPVFWPLDQTPLLYSQYLELIYDLAKRHLQPMGKILQTVLPGDLSKVCRILEIEDHTGKKKLNLKELQLASAEERKRIAQLWLQGRAYFLQEYSSNKEKYLALGQDPPWPIRPRAKNQYKLLEYLWKNGCMTKNQLQARLGKWIYPVADSLVQMGLVVQEEKDKDKEKVIEEQEERTLQLTSEQRKAFSYFLEDLERNEFRIRLLHGVTGSGKTLVYLSLAEKCLDKGKSVLLLVPEVALAVQMWSKVRAWFPENNIYLYHGYQKPRQRACTFSQLAQDNKPSLVVGTRSAVFLPRKDWGLIVLDEEHDSSYKQEERFHYQAKEVAFYWGQKCRSLLLLGSATPDIKTFYSTDQKFFPILNMNNRVGGGELPEIEILDLYGIKEVKGPFHPKADQMLQDCLRKGDQVIILLNRRGYAPLVYCTSCKQVLKCNHCDVGLTYHKGIERLLCHYCGSSKNFPLACPYCGSHQYVPINSGTEQVEEYLSSRLDPGTGVLRLDRDNTRRSGSLEEILDRFSRGEAQVLIGTQMCSKGHHFPDVTLVIVLDGDIGLNLPDYRATERTYQLLVQVAGRAGRGPKSGRVVIQTRNPDHYCWQYILDNNFRGFYEYEIALRQRFNYPPFVKLGMLRMSYPVHWEKGFQAVQQISKYLKDRSKKDSLRILGPAPAPLSRLRGRFRYQCLIKANSWPEIRSLCAPVLQRKSNSKLRISLDLDPIQML